MNKFKILLSLGIGTLILSIIGLYNGYPLVYSDTGTYIYSGFDKFIPNDRPITYGLFLYFFSMGYSAWFVIVVQNFLTAFVIYETLKIFAFQSSLFIKLYYSVLLFLVMFTGIGWYSNQLMPDFFAPLAMLIIFTLIAGENLSFTSKTLLILILIYSLISHLSNLLIGTVLIITILSIRVLLKRKFRYINFKRTVSVSLVVIAAWIILPGINYIVEKKFILSKGSHVFIMAHLCDTGILKKYLNENCDKPEFKDSKLCQFKDALPDDLASFMWGGDLLEKTGGWQDSRKEYDMIISATLTQPKYLFLNIYRSITYGMVQLTKNEIGQGLTANNEGSAPYGQILWRFPDELKNYSNSRQNKWNGINMNFEKLNTIHLVILVLSLFVFILLITNPIYMQIDTLTKMFLNFVFLAIIINSFVTAGLNSPCERFQARVVWLLPFSIIILLVKNNKLVFKDFSSVLFKK
jgi:hypothetical protein